MLATLTGIAAVAMGLIAMSRTDDGVLRKFNLWALGLWAAYYILLGLPYAALACLPGMAIVWARIAQRDNWVNLLNLGGGALVAWTAFTAGFFAAMPVAGSAMINVAVSLFSGARLTAMVAAGQCAWLIYAVMSGAWLAAVNSLLIFGALVMRSQDKGPRHAEIKAV